MVSARPRSHACVSFDNNSEAGPAARRKGMCTFSHVKFTSRGSGSCLSCVWVDQEL